MTGGGKKERKKNMQVVVEITVVDDGGIKGRCVLLNDLVRLLGNHRR